MNRMKRLDTLRKVKEKVIIEYISSSKSKDDEFERSMKKQGYRKFKRIKKEEK